MEAHQELFEIAQRLQPYAEMLDAPEVKTPLDAIEAASKDVGRSFSGSWLGYHARVYYEGLVPPPPGANFSQEWGLEETFGNRGSRGNWLEHDPDAIKNRVFAIAGEPDLTAIVASAKEAEKVFLLAKGDITSILTTEIADNPDVFLDRLIEDISPREPKSSSDFAEYISPKDVLMTRDSLALSQGKLRPPHLDLLVKVYSLRHAFGICGAAADISRKGASHLERKGRRKRTAERVGTNVFIGHGRSLLWRELKDFVEDRLKLPWDEFNRVPVAGVTNISRLAEMLDAAAIALLVLTGEDEMADGGHQARMNVIHEAGLFQGRLGFTKAIVLLEDGCEEFSNINGLGQIRFPTGNISAAYEEVRLVLEREGLLGTEG